MKWESSMDHIVNSEKGLHGESGLDASIVIIAENSGEKLDRFK